MKKILLGLLASSTLLGLQASGGDDDESKRRFDPDRLLRGQYFFVSSQNCTQSPAGFAAAPLFTPLGQTSSQSTTTQGIITYNGDGTASLTARSTSITTNVITSTPALSDISCTVSYQLGSRGVYNAQQNCTGTNQSGPAVGATFTLSPQRTNGFLRDNVLLTSSDGLTVETITANGVVTPRVCHRATTTSRLALLPR